ncbi:MAG TPA: CHAT domain-containing protein [Candidatus Angelobacter sp.]|nr:CHAT domain-containing protein [Candidatus Angelobacter sp.]
MKRGPNALTGLLLLFALGAYSQQTSIPSPADSRQRPGETRVAAESLFDRAKAALQKDDLDGAEKFFQQSLFISERLVPGSLAVARSLNGLGDVAQQRGEPGDAEAYYQQSLAILHELDPSGTDAANSLDGLARAASDRGDVAKTEEYALRAFAIREKLDSNSLDFALSLNTMAGVYNERGQPDKAEESYQKALSIQGRLAPNSLALAETLRNLGRFCFSRRRYDEGETYHRRAWTIREKLAPDGLAVADSVRWLGVCARNHLDEAERYWRTALTIQEKLAPDSVHVAVTLNLLTAGAQSRGDWLAAEGYDRKMLAIWEKLALHGPRVRNVLVDLSNVLVWRGDLAGAEEIARRGLEENRKVDPAGKNVAWGLFTLGNVAMARGNLAASDDYYHQALAISQRVDPGGMMPARMMRGLGMIAESRGDLGKAEDYYRSYLATWEKINPNGDNFAQGLFTLGCVAHDRGDMAQAERYYQRALAIWTRTAPEGLFMAQVLGKLGQLSRDKGDLASAEEYLRRAIAIEEKRTPESPDLAQGLSDLGDVLLARGALSEALESHQQALAIREKLLPGSAAHAASLAALAAVMRRKGELDAAAQYYQEALNALENQVVRLGSGDELRAGFRAKHASYYKDYIDLLVGQKRFELAFQVLERFRARTLLETLAMARAEIRKGADPALLQQQRALQESLAAKNYRRIQLLGTRGSDEELVVLEKEIQSLRSQCQEVEERIRAGSPSYAALVHPPPITAKETQEQLLDEDTVLLEYSLGGERSYLWVLTRDSLATYELPKRSDIEETARETYHLLTSRDEIHTQESPSQKQARLDRVHRAYRDKAATLSRMVLGPIARQIENKKRLLIVSDGALQYIPFAALPVPETTTANLEKQTVPLLAKHEIVNLPSASVLAVLRQQESHRPPAPKAVAVLADAVFAPTDPRVKRDGQRGSSVATVSPANQENKKDKDAVSTDFPDVSSGQLTRSAADVGLSGSGTLSLPRLPFSRREADAIMAVTPDGLGMKAVDFDASREMATSPELAQYRIVHFATHGLLDSEHPELSGLVLSLVDSRGRGRDGFLQLEDIYNLNLPADLVVLSACETGLGKEVNGEGLIGLTRGFMYAGATRVVSSLWKVDDFATAKLMKAFYASMQKDRKRPAEALREAQLSLLQDRHWSAPYYWAAFTIQGEWK